MNGKVTLVGYLIIMIYSDDIVGRLIDNLSIDCPSTDFTTHYPAATTTFSNELLTVIPNRTFITVVFSNKTSEELLDFHRMSPVVLV